MYTPILRWKEGERIALNHLSGAGRAGTVPHLVLAQPQYGDTRPPRKPPKTSSKKKPLSGADVFAKQVADAWGIGKCYLDASDLPGSSAVHHLDNIAASARPIGLHLVPSTRLTAPTEYQSAVQRMLTADGAGAALRISLAELTAASTWVRNWFCPIGETDLIIDIGASVANVAALGSPVAMAFAALEKAENWRSVTLAGGNIPANLTGYSVGLTPLPRTEMVLWKSLNAHGLPYMLHFGDYATVGPEATTENIPGPVPVNVKYTLKTDFLVFHGVKTKGPGHKARDVQYLGYAKTINRHPTRDAIPYCWADSAIDGIATGKSASAGSPSYWVGFSVNRHIELTRDQLP